MVPDRAPDGSVRGFFSIGIDVTERSATESALRAVNTVLDHSADLIVQTDARGRFTYLNPACRRALGLAADAPLPAEPFATFNTPAARRLTTEAILPAIREHGAWVGETSVLVAGGRELPVSQLVIGHRDERGRITRYSAVMRDITRQVEARRQMQQQTATLLAVCQSIPSIVAVVGLDSRYRFVNDAFERWVGAPRERIVGRHVREVLGHADYERVEPWMRRGLAGEAVQFEREYKAPDQSRFFAGRYQPLYTENGAVDGFVAVLTDISQHRHETSRLLQLSQLDPLTGLLNRAGLMDVLTQKLADGAGERIALLYIDLDRFKPVNDHHGHRVGDELLKAFADRLRQRLRPTDSIARPGGDEFIVVLYDVRHEDDAASVAASIVEQAAQPYRIGDRVLQVGASVGVAWHAARDSDPHDLIARADAMLFAAKHDGRGTHATESLGTRRGPAAGPPAPVRRPTTAPAR